MNEEVYKKIKTLLDAGLKTKVVSELTGSSTATVDRVNRSANLSEYLENNRQALARRKNNDSAKRATPSFESPQEPKTAKPINTTSVETQLARIADTLATMDKHILALLETWQPVEQTKKKGLFR